MKKILILFFLCSMSYSLPAQSLLGTLMSKAKNAIEKKTKDVAEQEELKSTSKKMVDVKLTGTIREEVTLRTANGQEETITSLPYTFKVPKGELPMDVTFESPNYEYSTITVHKKEEGGIGRVYILHNEKKAFATTPVIQQTVVQTPVEQTVAVNKVNWNKGVNIVPKTNLKSSNTFALIIANEEYELVAPVAMANNDGEVFKEYCKNTLGLSENQIKYYPNASFGKMARAFREVKDIAEAFNGDINLIVYYAGHGIPDNATKDAYLLPIDADGTDTGVCYSLQSMYQQIENLHINQCVVFMDACFSGAKRDGDMIVAARGVAIKPKESKPKSSTIVFSATSDEQAAYSYEKEQHGLFTYFLLKRLQETKGKATLGDLADYLNKEVSKNSIIINGKKQTPTIVVSDELTKTWKNLKLTK